MPNPKAIVKEFCVLCTSLRTDFDLYRSLLESSALPEAPAAARRRRPGTQAPGRWRPNAAPTLPHRGMRAVLCITARIGCPCRRWVKKRNARNEQIFSAMPRKRTFVFVAKEPINLCRDRASPTYSRLHRLVGIGACLRPMSTPACAVCQAAPMRGRAKTNCW